MADFSPADKTEAATPRRREEAWKRGQVAVSPDLTAAVTLLAAALGLRLMGPTLGDGLAGTLTGVLPVLPHGVWGVSEVAVWSRWFQSEFVSLTAVALVGLTAVGVLATALQTGFRFSLETIEINWSRIDPVAGWSKIMSLDGLVRGAMALLKLLLVLGIAAGVIWSQRTQLRVRSQGTLPGAILTGWDTAVALITWVACGAAALALADFLFRRFRPEQQIRMTRRELLDENKEEQGDPLIRSQRRARQRDAAARKSLKDVPEATLVVANPTHFAVALQYRQGQAGAPRVVAKGRGRLALRIREIAGEHGVPVIEHKPLARALYKLAEIGREIPVEFYQAVAEILAQIYRRKYAA